MKKDYETKRKVILEKIKEITNNLGAPPGMGTFDNITGIKKWEWQGRIWAKWSDALIEAGFEPNSLDSAFDKEDMVLKLIELARKLNKIPTDAEIRLEKMVNPEFPSPSTIRMHYKTFGGLVEAAKVWLLNQSGDEGMANLFSKYDYKAPKLVEVQEHPRISFSEALLSNDYLPPILACLPDLAEGKQEIVDYCKKMGIDENVEFEKRILIAFKILGLTVKAMGQGAGRVADGMAICRQGGWAIIYDAKVRRMGFRIGTEDRKFKEYIDLHSSEIFQEGITKIYFAVISSSFMESDVSKAKELTRTTNAKSFVLLEAKAILKMVECRLTDIYKFGFEKMERIVMESRIITANEVQ